MFCIFFLYFSLVLFCFALFYKHGPNMLTWNSICRSGWCWTLRSACFCLLCAGTKGVTTSLTDNSYYKAIPNLTKCLFFIYWDDPPFWGCCIISWLVYLEPSIHPCDESLLSLLFDLCKVLLNLVCYYFVENVCFYSL